MPVLTVCNHKGGTGKTTSTIHLAAAFGHSGLRVLVIDFDPQGFLTRMADAPEPAPDVSSLALLDPEADLTRVPTVPRSGFDLIGASQALTRAIRQLTKPTDVMWLRETLSAGGHGYDLILLDTAAALSVFTMNCLAAADAVVIPVTPEYQPVVGAEQTWQTCGLVRSKLNPRMAEPRFLLTQVDARLNRHARYAAYLRETYGRAVLETPIRTSSALAVVGKGGQTAFDHRVLSRGAMDYAAAADEIGALFDPPPTRPVLHDAAKPAPAAPHDAAAPSPAAALSRAPLGQAG